MKNYRCLALAALIIFALGVISPAKALEITEETQLQLARGFIDQGEYYRAVTELKRLAILFPKSQHLERATYAEALASYLGEEYERAAQLAFGLARDNPTGERAFAASYLQSLAYWKSKQHKMALGALSVVEASPADRTAYEKEKIACTKAVYLMEAGHPKAGLVALKSYLEVNPDAASARAGMAALEKFDDMPTKSPTLAGVLSALLPGAGYAYAGRWGDGAASLLLNGLFAAAAYDLLRDDKYAAGYLVGSIGLSFYVGNIYGSANAAHRFNLKVLKGRRDDVVGVLSLQLIAPDF
jgi:outer membrane protein assembly factor BamD (BamD/ComL family)/TM2 domain-containing membrane protein YozV